MSNKTYDVPEVLAALRDVVADKGADYMYPEELKNRNGNCVYVRDGRPACIVGHVLARLNFNLLGQSVVRRNGSAGMLDGVTGRAAQALRQAQRTQDSGDSWGLALAAAEEVTR